jgi:DNA-directed RNA polymerase subunit L
MAKHSSLHDTGVAGYGHIPFDYRIHPYLNSFQVPNHRWMIVKVLELEKDKVHLIIQGEGHTFMNALVEEILSDPDVDVARYMIEFQFSDPELLVTTKGKKNPLPIIKKACKRITGHCDELIKGIKKVKS